MIKPLKTKKEKKALLRSLTQAQQHANRAYSDSFLRGWYEGIFSNLLEMSTEEMRKQIGAR